jgi:predicted TIM-barrel fold metal-dependent hydrolase
MNAINRRSCLKTSAVTSAALSLPGQFLTAQTLASESPVQPTGIIDTNVDLFSWPFRKLKYGDTKALVAKLQKHRVIQAWAGSFEALLHKDMDGVNTRLADECEASGGGILVPFGSVNLAWPDWEEDERRCHEVHKMPGIRLYPGYQPFGLDHPALEKLLKMIEERGMILQVVFGMEDPRVHHPIISVDRAVSASLIKALKAAPNAKVMLLHFIASPRGEDLHEFMTQSNVTMDISRFEGTGALARIIGSVPGVYFARAPIERIVFGSHSPFFPVETAILKLIESPLDAGQLQAIMQGNARRLLPEV